MTVAPEPPTDLPSREVDGTVTQVLSPLDRDGYMIPGWIRDLVGGRDLVVVRETELTRQSKLLAKLSLGLVGGRDLEDVPVVLARQGRYSEGEDVRIRGREIAPTRERPVIVPEDSDR